MVFALVAAALQTGCPQPLHLHLGYTRISDVGLRALAGLPSLTAFSCEGELISEEGAQVGC